MSKVLHVVSSLHHGAVEKWLMTNFLRAKEQYPQLDWTFYCVFDIDGEHESAMRKAGATVIHAKGGWGRPYQFMKHLREVLRTGKYDVLHAHHDLMSVLPLLASLALPLKSRWVHVHNADQDLPTPSNIKRALVLPIFRLMCLTIADGIVGITDHTLRHFVGDRYPRPQDRVIYYGVDTDRFRFDAEARESMRQELNIPIDAQVILFVARMNWFKNPCFVIEMLRYMDSTEDPVYAIFVGEGALLPEVEKLSDSYGLTDRVRMVGWRNDTERFYSAADLFVFPRVEANSEGVGKEGLGLTLVEAQSSGLGILTSFGVSDEAKVIPTLFLQAHLDLGAEAWAQKAKAELTSRNLIARPAFADKVAGTRFGLTNGVSRLLSLY